MLGQRSGLWGTLIHPIPRHSTQVSPVRDAVKRFSLGALSTEYGPHRYSSRRSKFPRQKGHLGSFRPAAITPIPVGLSATLPLPDYGRVARNSERTLDRKRYGKGKNV